MEDELHVFSHAPENFHFSLVAVTDFDVALARTAFFDDEHAPTLAAAEDGAGRQAQTRFAKDTCAKLHSGSRMGVIGKRRLAPIHFVFNKLEEGP